MSSQPVAPIFTPAYVLSDHPPLSYRSHQATAFALALLALILLQVTHSVPDLPYCTAVQILSGTTFAVACGRIYYLILKENLFDPEKKILRSLGIDASETPTEACLERLKTLIPRPSTGFDPHFYCKMGQALKIYYALCCLELKLLPERAKDPYYVFTRDPQYKLSSLAGPFFADSLKSGYHSFVIFFHLYHCFRSTAPIAKDFYKKGAAAHECRLLYNDLIDKLDLWFSREEMRAHAPPDFMNFLHKDEELSSYQPPTGTPL